MIDLFLLITDTNSLIFFSPLILFVENIFNIPEMKLLSSSFVNRVAIAFIALLLKSPIINS